MRCALDNVAFGRTVTDCVIGSSSINRGVSTDNKWLCNVDSEQDMSIIRCKKGAFRFITDESQARMQFCPNACLLGAFTMVIPV